MKIIKDNIIAIIMSVLILTIILIIQVYGSMQNEYRAKLDLLNTQNTKLKEISNTQSDIEILGSSIGDADRYSKELLDRISKSKKEITLSEKEYERFILTKRCLESQMSRLNDSLEYNLNYCKEKSNLEQFRIKKY